MVLDTLESGCWILIANLDDSSIEDGKEKSYLDPSILEKRLCATAKSGDLSLIRRHLQKTLRRLKKEGKSPRNFKTAALYHAAASGNLAVCEVLIAFGCDIEVGYRDVPPLVAAINSAQEEIVDLLIKNRASPTSRDGLSRTPLHCAILRGTLPPMQTLIDAGASVNATDCYETSCLYYACNQVDISAAKILLDNGAEVNAICKVMRTPLIVAVLNGNLPLAVLLLDYGAKVDGIEGPHLLTPLETAVRNQKPEIAHLLLQRGANIDLTQTQSTIVTPPLHYAAYNGYVQLVELLLEWNPDLELKDANNLTPLFVSMAQPNLEITRMLLAAGADVNAVAYNSASTLGVALSKKRLDLVQLLIDHGFVVDQRNGHDQKVASYLSIAAKQGGEDVVLILLENKANVDVCDMNGTTPLMIAAQRDHSGIVNLLLKYGANIKAVDRQKHTALHFAARNHSTSTTMSLLLENTSEVDVISLAGMTPLMIAAQNDLPGNVEILLAHGANPNRSCHDQMTPLHRAAACADSSKTLALILGKNAKVVDLRDIDGETPLMSALRFDHICNVEVLLAHGANPNLRQEDGYTYLHHAARFGSLRMVSLLLEKGADPNYDTVYGFTPYMLSVDHGHTEIADVLREITTLSPDPSPISSPEYESYEHTSHKPAFFNSAHQINDDDVENMSLKSHVASSQSPKSVITQDSLPIGGLTFDQKLDARDELGNTPLWDAVARCDEIAVQILCNRGADVNLSTFEGGLPLVFAARSGYINIVHILLKHDANPEATDQYGASALHASTSPEITEALIDGGCFINIKSRYGLEETPLCMAIMERLDSVVRVLIDRGADITMPVDATNKSPLILAINYHRPSIVKWLIKGGCNVNPSTDFNVTKVSATPLMSAVFSSKSVELINILIDNGARLEERSLGDETALEAAARLNIKPAFDALVQCGAEINGSDKDGLTPLMKMVKAHAINSVKMLLEAGADYNASISLGSHNTALHIAAGNSNRPAIMQVLLKHGANMEVKNSAGHTPLVLAALNNCNAMVDCLVRHGADINAQDKNGHTALMTCVIKLKIPQVEMLLKNGADVHFLHPQSGMQAVHFAAELPNTSIMTLLLDGGADINSLGNQQKSAVDFAVTAGNSAMVELLCQRGGKTISESLRDSLTEVITMDNFVDPDKSKTEDEAKSEM